MKNLLPPSRSGLRRNSALLAAEWRKGSPLQRYFMASQLLSGALLGLCSLGSLVAAWAGLQPTSQLLLGAAAVSFIHSVGTWSVLKRRFQISYDVW